MWKSYRDRNSGPAAAGATTGCGDWPLADANHQAGGGVLIAANVVVKAGIGR